MRTFGRGSSGSCQRSQSVLASYLRILSFRVRENIGAHGPIRGGGQEGKYATPEQRYGSAHAPELAGRLFERLAAFINAGRDEG